MRNKKPMVICAHNSAHVSKKHQQKAKENSPCSVLTKEKKKQTRDSYKGTKPLRMD